MAKRKDTSTNTARRAARQRLQSLQGAGVTHLPKPRRHATAAGTPADPVAPSGASQKETAAQASGGPEDRAAALAALAREVAACTRCEELVRNRTQTVLGAGDPHARLVFIGEAPGADEDRRGEPFVGAAGQLLTDMIEKGMKLRRRDVYIMNILRCRPPGNRQPLPAEAARCRPFLDRQLAIVQPELICCLGACAAQNLLGRKAPLGELRGRVHDYQGIKVICTYHPAYLLRMPSAKRATWEDLQMLMRQMGLPVPNKG